ncbi:MOSC domain-containing protein [Aestuariivirga litoralis]|uniref:MOSC domain-containing protein n=1 Tax=Aestuariivirga litoralis TaxID=2650924 RepID=UPI0018C63B10|nr:MOSC domain-containing protein [Aestuariivirga litoralis]MBG1233717.1 MOSC domain-containing protein [Aestuariivirga litoralis]
MVLVHKVGFEGKVEKLFSKTSRENGFEKPERDSLNLLLSGPEGDCHAGDTREADSRTLLLYKRGTKIRNVRQITIVAPDELAEVAERLGIPEVDPIWLGANMLISGIPDLTLLPPSTRIQFPSGATLVVDMENAPCSQVTKVIVQHHGEAGWGFVKAATNKRGVTAWVEREGDVKVGDAARLFLPPTRLYAHG